jgi:N-carbamoylsarcosine amidase
MSDDVTELKQRLEEAFREATKLYQTRGFQRRIGFGRKPALVNVDLANAWTRPGNPFTCEDTSPASKGCWRPVGQTVIWWFM